jgi:hypothetical protein
MEGQFEISREKVPFFLQLSFVWMKASLVAYDYGELHKK